MSDILDEQKADKIVIINLLKEIQKLKGLKNTMGKLLIDVNGDVYFSEVHTIIAESDVDTKVDEARKQISEYEAVQALADKLRAQSEAPAPKAPIAAPASVDQAAPAPVTPVAQPEQPTAPVAPQQITIQ